jgi:hypothetical protein
VICLNELGGDCIVDESLEKSFGGVCGVTDTASLPVQIDTIGRLVVGLMTVAIARLFRVCQPFKFARCNQNPGPSTIRK